MAASTERSLDMAAARFAPAMSKGRLAGTSEEELRLALSSSPTSRERWINPQLGAVYVISNAANSLLKIGHADNLKNRFSGIDCCCPVALKLEHFVYFVGRLVANSVEQQTHAVLKEYRRKGEWFDVPLAIATEAIASVVSSRKLTWWTEYERRELGSKASRVHINRMRQRGMFLSA